MTVDDLNSHAQEGPDSFYPDKSESTSQGSQPPNGVWKDE